MQALYSFATLLISQLFVYQLSNHNDLRMVIWWAGAAPTDHTNIQLIILEELVWRRAWRNPFKLVYLMFEYYIDLESLKSVLEVICWKWETLFFPYWANIRTILPFHLKQRNHPNFMRVKSKKKDVKRNFLFWEHLNLCVDVLYDLERYPAMVGWSQTSDSRYLGGPGKGGGSSLIHKYNLLVR